MILLSSSTFTPRCGRALIASSVGGTSKVRSWTMHAGLPYFLAFPLSIDEFSLCSRSSINCHNSALLEPTSYERVAKSHKGLFFLQIFLARILVHHTKFRDRFAESLSCRPCPVWLFSQGCCRLLN